jgi:hypothetical protein
MVKRSRSRKVKRRAVGECAICPLRVCDRSVTENAGPAMEIRGRTI